MDIMDNNVDNIFKEKISSMDKKTVDWKKKETWELIQRRKSRHIFIKFLKYAAMFVIVFGSALLTLQILSKKGNKEHEMLSRQEKYEKLKIIEQRLSQEKGTSNICYTCFNPYLKTGTKPIENGFRVDIFY
jgi:hypothetical protein